MAIILTNISFHLSGYKNRSVFPKIAENRWNWAGPNLKTTRDTVHWFKISKKDKNQQNICKKLD
jgi:hypothetical protein